MLAKELILKTLQQIQREKVTATPEVYEKTFCQIAKKNGLDLDECKRAKPLINRLSDPLKTQLLNRNINALDELAMFLIGELNRSLILPQKDTQKIVNGLINIVAKAMTPSFADFDTEHIDTIINELENNPAKVLEKSWQNRMIKLVAERISFDRKKINSEAFELSSGVNALFSVVEHMSKDLKNDDEGLEKLRADIKVLDPENFTKELFKDLKIKLDLIAGNLKNHSSKMINTIDSQSKEIGKLKAQIDSLNSRMSCLIEENSTDYLTQVESRRKIDIALSDLEANYAKNGEDFALLFFDVDRFKNINDTYGHDGGDKILRALATLIKNHSTSSSTVGRYGGEEFVVILPQSDLIIATKLAENIRKEVESSQFKYQEKTIQMTISCGVATRSKTTTAKELLKVADKRLYKAKKSGRNRVIND